MPEQPKSQIDKFKEAARQRETDDHPDRFKERLETHACGEARVTPEERIAQGIRKALESCGFGVTQVKVTDFSPEVFGNHAANVETTAGAVRIIFDRQYELDLLESRIPPGHVPDIKSALSREFSAAIAVDL